METKVQKDFHSNGQVLCEEYYKDDKLHGPTRIYYANGQIMYEYIYYEDKLHGVHRSYYESGSRCWEQPYEHGKKHGVSKVYCEGGALEGSHYHLNGLSVSPEEYRTYELTAQLAGL